MPIKFLIGPSSAASSAAELRSRDDELPLSAGHAPERDDLTADQHLLAAVAKLRAEAKAAMKEAERWLSISKECTRKAEATAAIVRGDLQAVEQVSMDDALAAAAEGASEVERRRTVVKEFMRRVGVARNADVLTYLSEQAFDLGDEGNAKSKIHGDLRALATEGVLEKESRGTWRWTGAGKDAMETELD